MDYNKARTADDQTDDLESFWMSTPAERYRYGLLFSMLAGLAAVAFMFWRSGKTLPSMLDGGGKSESRPKAKGSAVKAAHRQTGQKNSVRKPQAGRLGASSTLRPAPGTFLEMMAPARRM